MCVVRRQYPMRPPCDRFLPVTVLAVITVMTFAAIAGSPVAAAGDLHRDRW
jgi:hypothetical protein